MSIGTPAPRTRLGKRELGDLADVVLGHVPREGLGRGETLVQSSRALRDLGSLRGLWGLGFIQGLGA